MNPPKFVVEEDAGGGLKPAKVVGGAGIEGAGLASESDDAAGFDPKLKDVAGGAGGWAEALGLPKENPLAEAADVVTDPTFLILSSYSCFALDRSDLYFSSSSAMSKNGSESTAFVTALTNDVLRPRSAR